MDLSNIDFKKLRVQKDILMRMIASWGEASDPIQQEEAKEAEGLIYLLDEIQDNAVSNLNLLQTDVFGPII